MYSLEIHFIYGRNCKTSLPLLWVICLDKTYRMSLVSVQRDEHPVAGLHLLLGCSPVLLCYTPQHAWTHTHTHTHKQHIPHACTEMMHAQARNILRRGWPWLPCVCALHCKPPPHPFTLTRSPYWYRRGRSLSFFLLSPAHSLDESVINSYGAGGKVIHLS